MKKLKHYLSKATNGNFAVGAINVFNLESIQAVADASANCNSPIIAAVSEKSLIYMQDYVKSLAKSARKTNPALFLHLDHGTTFEICKKAIDLGFDSVMIDASHLPLDENITLTKKVCCYAHKKGVLVEGELGKILGAEENASSTESIYTSPEEAARFVKETKVDMLAISIGTSHGIYKAGNGKLRFDVLQEIEKAVPNTPLVLHGASTINSALIDDFLAAGGKTKKHHSIDEKQLKMAATCHHIAKINTDSDIRLCFTSALRRTLIENPEIFAPRKYLGCAKEKIQKLIEEKIASIFNSKNKRER